MKKIYTLFMAAAIALTSQAQSLVINENFTGYTLGNLGTQGGWVQSGSGTDVQVKNTTPLMIFSPTYNSGGNYISVAQTNGTDPYKPFSTVAGIPTTSNASIFVSFVVRVSDAAKVNSAVYSISLLDTTTGATPLRFYIAEEQAANSTDLAFGVSVGATNNPAYTTFSFSPNTTYLIVIRYDIATGGTGNDDAYLWVDPSTTSEPSTATATNGTGATESNGTEQAYGSTIDALQISQSGSGSPIADYDAFRVAWGANSATAWTILAPAQSPLPVQLTSFNASQDNLNNIKLVWNTAEEMGIVSYVVEKSTDGRTFNAIGSVAAANQKTYSFTDVQSGSDYSYYRLKMMENDGSFKYSYIVSLKSKLSLNISLSPNPVKEKLLIQHPKVINEGHIQIINANGQFIKDVRVPASAVISTIDMSGLANGMYHVIFRNGSDMFTKTVLKQ
jgi:type IX secretion system substrate protein